MFNPQIEKEMQWDYLLNVDIFVYHYVASESPSSGKRSAGAGVIAASVIGAVVGILIIVIIAVIIMKRRKRGKAQ